MTKNQALASLVFAALLGMFGFQNCTKTSFSGQPVSVADSSSSETHDASLTSNQAAPGTGSSVSNSSVQSNAQLCTSLKITYLVNNVPATSVMEGQAYQIVFEIGGAYWDVVINTELSGQEIVYAPQYQGQGYADPGSSVRLVVSDFQRIDGAVSYMDASAPALGWKFVTNPIVASRSLSNAIFATPYTSQGRAACEVQVDLPVH